MEYDTLRIFLCALVPKPSFRVFLSLSSITNIDICKDVTCHFHKLASWASVYTDAPFRQTRPPARFAKPACWGHPQSPYDCQLRCQAERRFNPLVTITYNKKTGQGRSGIHPFLPCPSHHYCYNSFRCCLAASRSFFRSSP